MNRVLSVLIATLLLGGVVPSLSCACGSSSQATPTVDAAFVDGGSPKKDGGIVDLDSDGGPKPDAGNATLEAWPRRTVRDDAGSGAVRTAVP